MKTAWLIALPAFLVSCTPSQPTADSPLPASADAPANNRPDVADVPQPTTEQTVDGCYRFAQGRDTALLQLKRTGAKVTGSLEYRWAEKDRNKGTFNGEQQGNLLRGWYRFSSEGMMSVREVQFQVEEDGSLREGTGEVVSEGDTARFRTGAAVAFGAGLAFRPVACDAVR